MDIIFFGSSEFALPSLQALVNSKHKLLLVVTHPDRKKERHLLFSPSPIKSFAKSKSLEVFQPGVLDESNIGYLKERGIPDLFVVVSFGKILNKKILGVPKIFSICVHPSFLPKYRGAAPINWAIINGERKTGVTVIKMNERIDSGDIILQEEVDIEPEDTAITLEAKLSKRVSQALLKAIDLIEKNDFSLLRQDESMVSFAQKLKKSDGLIDWKDTAENIHNRVRGLMRWPGVFTYWKDKLLKIWRTSIESMESIGFVEPGEIVKVSKKEIIVACGKSYLGIKELQLESRKRLTTEQFIAGHRISLGERLGQKYLSSGNSPIMQEDK